MAPEDPKFADRSPKFPDADPGIPDVTSAIYGYHHAVISHTWLIQRWFSHRWKTARYTKYGTTKHLPPTTEPPTNQGAFRALGVCAQKALFGLGRRRLVLLAANCSGDPRIASLPPVLVVVQERSCVLQGDDREASWKEAFPSALREIAAQTRPARNDVR